jgi:hypothetical protein
MSAASLTFSQVGYVNKSFWRNPARAFFTSTSSAYAWGLTISGIQIGFDLVPFETGTYAGLSWPIPAWDRRRGRRSQPRTRADRSTTVVWMYQKI